VIELVLDMFRTILHFYCTFTTIMNISSRCFRAACVITALLIHSFAPILVGHDPAMVVLNTYKINVLTAWSFPIMRTLSRPYCACGDTTLFPLQIVTIGHVFSQFVIVVEVASVCERGVRNNQYCKVRKKIVHTHLSTKALIN
jgi:hypothetical protein